MYNSIESFHSVACHLELAILSGMFGITEHAQSNAVEYFSIFFSRIHVKFYKICILPGYGYKTSKTSNLLRFFNFSEEHLLTNAIDCHECVDDQS